MLTFTDFAFFAIFYRMKTVFANFIEAERYLRKHLDLPGKLRFKSYLKSFVEPQNNKHPAIPGMHTGYIFEYHGRFAYVAVVPYAIPVKRGLQWSMEDDYSRWHFVDVTTWSDITEEEFIEQINNIIKE